MPWKHQLQNRLKTAAQFSARFGRPAPTDLEARLALGLTPYYADLCEQTPELLKTVWPDEAELETTPFERADPMDEEAQSPVPAVVRRYPNRALLLLTPHCPVYCRYCTRSRKVGKAQSKLGPDDWKEGIEWIAGQPEIEEVILSGGEPLVLADAALAQVLEALEALPQVKFLRFSTKVPAVLPMRVTEELARLLGSFGPLLLNLHFTHPAELTPQADLALKRLREAGVMLASQTVLLQGVNDRPETLAELYLGLYQRGVRPYALYLCDWISGAGHFRVGPERALELMQSLRARLSGPLLPRLIADPPGGKAELGNAWEPAGGGWKLKNWAGEEQFWPQR